MNNIKIKTLIISSLFFILWCVIAFLLYSNLNVQNNFLIEDKAYKIIEANYGDGDIYELHSANKHIVQGDTIVGDYKLIYIQKKD